MSESNNAEPVITDNVQSKRDASPSWGMRFLLHLLFWAFFLAGVVFYGLSLIPLSVFIGIVLNSMPSVNSFLLPTFCFGIALYFHQLLKGWKKQGSFPGFGYGFPSAIVVWIVGDAVSILQNWFFALLFNSHKDFCLVTFFVPTIAIIIAVILGFKAGKEGGRTAALVQKASAFLTRYKTAVFTLIAILIITSVVGQQIYYRTATQLSFLTQSLTYPASFNHAIFWNYFAFSHIEKCPYNKFQNLKSFDITKEINFSSLPAIPCIKELQFQGNHFLTEADMKRLAQFTGLERLELHYWNNLKDSDSTGLKYLSQIKGLKDLTLDVTVLSADDIPLLKDIPNLESLTLHIYPRDGLFDSEIDYASLQSAPKLKTLKLTFQDGIDENEVQRAREELPKCIIKTE